MLLVCIYELITTSLLFLWGIMFLQNMIFCILGAFWRWGIYLFKHGLSLLNMVFGTSTHFKTHCQMFPIHTHLRFGKKPMGPSIIYQSMWIHIWTKHVPQFNTLQVVILNWQRRKYFCIVIAFQGTKQHFSQLCHSVKCNLSLPSDLRQVPPVSIFLFRFKAAPDIGCRVQQTLVLSLTSWWV
jgi:hypothetical protein